MEVRASGSVLTVSDHECAGRPDDCEFSHVGRTWVLRTYMDVLKDTGRSGASVTVWLPVAYCPFCGQELR